MEVYTCDSASYVIFRNLAFLMLNLETSEVLIFATSCIKSKECFIYVQRYNFFSKFNVHIIKIGEMYY